MSKQSRYYRIEVAEEDIRKGVVSDCQNCPIAIAVNRATEPHGLDCADVSSISVTCDRWVGNVLKNLEGDLAPVARQFIADFDIGKPVKPFKFGLTLEYV